MLSNHLLWRWQVAAEQRDYAKQLAYGLLYGKGPHALAVDLSCDVKKAAKQQDSFMRAIPKVVGSTFSCFSLSDNTHLLYINTALCQLMLGVPKVVGSTFLAFSCLCDTSCIAPIIAWRLSDKDSIVLRDLFRIWYFLVAFMAVVDPAFCSIALPKAGLLSAHHCHRTMMQNSCKNAGTDTRHSWPNTSVLIHSVLSAHQSILHCALSLARHGFTSKPALSHHSSVPLLPVTSQNRLYMLCHTAKLRRCMHNALHKHDDSTCISEAPVALHWVVLTYRHAFCHWGQALCQAYIGRFCTQLEYWLHAADLCLHGVLRMLGGSE